MEQTRYCSISRRKIHLVFTVLLLFRISNGHVISNDLNKFSRPVYEQFGYIKDVNLACTPITIYTLLSLMYIGAEGTTAEQILNSLKGVEYPLQYKAYLANITKGNTQNVYFKSFLYFNTRDKIFNKTYISTVKKVHNCSVSYASFSAKVRDTGIKFYETPHEKLKNTQIKQSKLTQLVIISSAYYQAVWKYPFNVDDTAIMPFLVNKQKRINVKMMNIVNQELRYEDSVYLQSKLLECPFVGDRFSIIFILPYESDGLDRYLVKKLEKTEYILQTINKLKKRFVHAVAIPKFSFRKDYNLQELVYNLGITDLFEDANFGAIASKPLKVTTATHRVVLEINETYCGSVSDSTAIIEIYKKKSRRIMQKGYASSTYVYNDPGSVVKREYKKIIFSAMYPFAFVLYDRKQNVILSVGKVYHPIF